jgi:hypothetical protein
MTARGQTSGSGVPFMGSHMRGKMRCWKGTDTWARDEHRGGLVLQARQVPTEQARRQPE